MEQIKKFGKRKEGKEFYTEVTKSTEGSEKRERDLSLRPSGLKVNRRTTSREVMRKEKTSGCFVRNNRWVVRLRVGGGGG
jgi:hypothetical protein